MRLAITLARENIARGSGGPFGAAIFARGASRPFAVGVNCVERLRNAMLHAEVVALMLAEARLGSYTLRAPGAPEYELFTSCAPCAMCLGATLWSGVRRIVCAAGREDAMALGFDEGPVFPEILALPARRRASRSSTACSRRRRPQVMRRYREGNGLVYNGWSASWVRPQIWPPDARSVVWLSSRRQRVRCGSVEHGSRHPLKPEPGARQAQRCAATSRATA
ncbi:MAG: nucleoside deaminase [Gammaproteobacteria bacterium]|nr:nucleoside deaminase [Gammaproteobacteria bacterium]